MDSTAISTSYKARRALGFVFLGLSLLEGLLALLWILAEPSDADVWRFLGYSAQRWLIILAALSATVVFSALFYMIPTLLLKPEEKGYARLRGAFARIGLPVPPADMLIPLLFLSVRIPLFLQTLSANRHPSAGAMFLRIAPLSILLALLFLQMLLFLFALRPPAIKANFRWATVAWAACIAFGAGLLLTGFGLVCISNGCYEYGVPLTHTQVLDLSFAGYACVRASLLARRPFFQKLASRTPRAALDVLIMLAIWLAAVYTWLPTSIPTTWFSPAPLPPGYAVYPSSDASLYDASALGILLGTEWARTTVHYKPLYVAFLAAAHAAAGYAYEPAIRIQTLALALLPVLFYLIGRSVYSRTVGVLVAAAMIAREYNQLVVGSLVTTSNTKLMLSELPTAVGISLLVVVLIGWLKSPPGIAILRNRSALALLAGGIIGLSTQIRMQSLALLPAVMVLAVLFYARRWQSGLRTVALLALGFALALAPLLARNALVTGQWTIEKPGYMDRTLNYAFSPITEQQYSRPWMIGSGFVHNMAQALLVLPSGYHGEKPWTHTRDLAGQFWISEALDLSIGQFFWLLLNLWFICLGLAAAWQRSHWAALVPAFAFAGYNLASVVGGFSGQRFALPVDWVGYFYFVIGLIWLFEQITGSSQKVEESGFIFASYARKNEAIPRFIEMALMPVVAAALLCTGALLPAIEAAIPVRYGSASQAGARESLKAIASLNLAAGTGDPYSLDVFQEMLAQPDVVILQGVALYPREIMNDVAPGSFTKTDPEIGSPFLTYLYLGETSVVVLQPTNGDTRFLPHTSEVIVAGRWVRDHFHAFATALPAAGRLYFSPQSR